MLITETSTGNLQTVARLIEAGKIKPCIGQVYPLSAVAPAWRDSRSQRIEGKLVFTFGAGEEREMDKLTAVRPHHSLELLRSGHGP